MFYYYNNINIYFIDSKLGIVKIIIIFNIIINYR